MLAGTELGDEWDEKDDVWIRETFVLGRLWKQDVNDHNVIIVSFWDLDLVAKHKDNVFGELERRSKKLGQPIGEWYLDDLDGGLVKIKDFYLFDGMNFGKADLSKIHNLPSQEKRKTPQMQNVLRANEKMLGDKFGKKEDDPHSREVTQAEYNFYKRYGMGESKKHKKIYLSEEQVKLLKDFIN